jgi:hypothetical protein
LRTFIPSRISSSPSVVVGDPAFAPPKIPAQKTAGMTLVENLHPLENLVIPLRTSSSPSVGVGDDDKVVCSLITYQGL